MKKICKFSKVFNNRIKLPYRAIQEAFVQGCRLAETVEAVCFHHTDSSTHEDHTISIQIYILPEENINNERTAQGYILIDDWDGLLWYCNSHRKISQVLNDYRHYLEAELPKTLTNIKATRWMKPGE